MSFNPVIHVTGNSKVIKKIVKEGQGSVTADDGASVTSKSTDVLITILIWADKRNLDWKVVEGVSRDHNETYIAF